MYMALRLSQKMAGALSRQAPTSRKMNDNQVRSVVVEARA